MLKCLTLMTILITLLTNSRVSDAQEHAAVGVKVIAVGISPSNLPNAREAAIEDALRRCVWQSANSHLKENYQLVGDVLNPRMMRFVERYQVRQENAHEKSGTYTVKIEALVRQGQINHDISAWKTLLDRKGQPRVMIVGLVDGQILDVRSNALVVDLLKQHGVTPLDPRTLGKLKTRDAQRVARADKDPLQAALIAQQHDADILISMQIQALPPVREQYYGIERMLGQTTAIINVIRADTGKILASKAIDTKATADTHAQAIRDAADKAITQIVKDAMKDVADFWFEELDQNGGQFIQIVMHRFGFSRVNNLIAKLRNIEGIQSVTIDRTDIQGTGMLRVKTNSSAGDLAWVLAKLDQSLTIISSSANRMDVR